ncbi:hypothetical protein Y032_0212g2247 [Ancylostoma ceylanicum]|uniref:Uncharacterized protein n=1 Tax=Ancylostoma ceylanicum TaxID=53326 RepID=A0A016SJX6_9BILA|nr:hypothetical protein Y032_0212g2247 [Ancylostoma ceylanicum]
MLKLVLLVKRSLRFLRSPTPSEIPALSSNLLSNKTYPRICESTRFTAGYLYPVDFHMITINDLLLLHFVVTLAEKPHLRQEMSA